MFYHSKNIFLVDENIYYMLYVIFFFFCATKILLIKILFFIQTKYFLFSQKYFFIPCYHSVTKLKQSGLSFVCNPPQHGCGTSSAILILNQPTWRSFVTSAKCIHGIIATPKKLFSCPQALIFFNYTGWNPKQFFTRLSR